ncbi:peptidyl-prolyl cis-trans isomerase A (cyclophilin A) [Nocardiopsis arvandica]|uniref:Peptidyl-prolyl cis-trans isomerase n=1 Tax=Nocardiopsis sinuspersici TaxID=501010 RepID=A0A7Y9XBG1_9ACTN|nr:peptidylprolyl isomerase [Nocardiopsis sinuspersici]NYH51745.1 peptidyl-prolyl cis-trans isomerase A (cyclophilin A) [Nocardiopsis sinuspersici]
MKHLPLSMTALLAGTALLATSACGGGADARGGSEDGATGPDRAEGSEQAGGPADVDVSGVEGATLHTSEGDIEVELFPEDAPVTVANFVGLAEGEGVPNPVTGEAEFYDGTVFHRVIDDFMIQGGDPQGTGRGGPGYTFEDELGSGREFDEPGVLAMANSGPDTNGSQFFVTVEPTPHLNGMHTIFGHVADEESMEVVNGITDVETDAGDRPVQDVVLESVTVHRAE